MRTLLHHLKRYRLQCVLSPLFKMLEACMELIVPLLVKRMIDEGITGSSRAMVWQMGLLLVAFGLAGLLFSTIAQYFAAKAATESCGSLRRALFAKIQQLSYADLDETGTATLINRLTGDMNQVQTGVNMALRLALRSPFVVFGAMIMAFTVDTQCALIFAALIPVLTVLIVLIGQSASRGYADAQKKQDRVLLRTRENLIGVRVLRAFNRQQSELEGFSQDQQALYRQQLKVGTCANLLNPLTYVLVNLALIVLLTQGTSAVSVGRLTAGAVIALVNYLSQVLVELIKLTNLVNTISKGVASAGRVQRVMELPVSMQGGSVTLTDAVDSAENPLLSLERVSFRYPQAGEYALRDLHFSIRQGETFGIIGGTGSGKSTLLQLLGRFYDPTDGVIRYQGVPLPQLQPEALHAQLGMVPQKAVLFAGTLAQNLRWGRQDATDDDLWQALKAAQAEDFVRAMPLGLESPVEQDGRNFSGGQRQRLTIARALTRKPKLLLMDDSTSALDFATEAALRGALRALPFDTTLIIASQRASAVRFADRIAVLEDGRLAGLGTHEELMQSCEVYREIVLSQNPRNPQKEAAQ